MLHYIKKIITRQTNKDDISKKLINKTIKNPDFPWLISFPRTGSHWLRILMELYFQKPSLVRIFYFKDATEFTCYHRHDLELKIKNVNNIIYLYRNPVDTIYSQLNYHEQDTNDLNKIKYWSVLYGKHLTKWLIEEKFTKKKTIITYEQLKNNSEVEFEKICKHLNENFNSDNFKAIYEDVNKKNIKKVTPHDNKVINLSEDYQDKRKSFQENHKTFIYNAIYSCNEELKKYIL